MATLINYRLSEKKGIIQTAILTMELILLSTGLISTYFVLKKGLSPRFLIDMVLGSMWELVNSTKSLLSSPLYICLFINFFVILIFTFSKFHQPAMGFLSVFRLSARPQHHEKEKYMPKRTNSAIAMEIIMSFLSHYSHPASLEDIQDDMPSHVKDIEFDHLQKTSFPDTSHLTDAGEIKKPYSPNPDPDDDITNYHNTTKTKTNQTSQENIVSPHLFEELNIQPLMSPEEEELLEDDSLEATWKVITGGVNNEKKNQVLRKSETCKWPVGPEELVSAESIESKDLLPSVAATWKDLRKSLTFNDALSTFRRGGLRGDFSVSAEESNKKFDDFIKKINYERMLQRQESDDQRALKNLR